MTRRLVRKLLSLPVVAKGPMNTPTMLLPEELAQRIRECGDALTEHFSINPIDATLLPLLERLTVALEKIADKAGENQT